MYDLPPGSLKAGMQDNKLCDCPLPGKFDFCCKARLKHKP